MRTITIEPGDTLWAIAKRELHDAQRWREVFGLNAEALIKEQRRRHVSEGPDGLIFPGTILTMPGQSPKL